VITVFDDMFFYPFFGYVRTLVKRETTEKLKYHKDTFLVLFLVQICVVPFR